MVLIKIGSGLLDLVLSLREAHSRFQSSESLEQARLMTDRVRASRASGDHTSKSVANP